MKTSHLFALAVIASLPLTGCASTMGSVIPQPGGVYQVIGHGYNKQEALDMALYTAKTTCAEDGKRHVVKGMQTFYKGMLAEGANAVVYRVTGFFSSDSDYNVQMEFTCEP